MESVIADNLSDYLHKHSLISNYQHGFQKKKSPCTSLIQSLNEWSLASDENHQTDVIYLDFARAFHSVCHRKLFIKLYSIGIEYELLSWIKDFLIGRSQQVIVDGILSKETPIISGIPQGSVLGPILFMIYVNDITRTPVENCEIRLFADDIKIYQNSSVGDFCDLHLTLENICKWSNKWQLSLSTNKCQVISFGKNIVDESYFLNNFLLQKTSEVRDLGILFSSNLEFSHHCQLIASKALSRAFLVLKCFSINDPRILVKAYSVFVRPIVEYCTQVWSPRFVKDIAAIEKVQKYFTRQVCRRAGIAYENYCSRLLALGLQSLERRRLFFDLVLVFKLLYQLIDIPFFYLLFFFHLSPKITRGHTC